MTGQCTICLALLTSQDSTRRGPEGIMHTLSLFTQTVSAHHASFHKPGATLGKTLSQSPAPAAPESMPAERHTAQIAMALGLSAQVQAYISMAAVTSTDPSFRTGMETMRKTFLGLFSVPLAWEQEAGEPPAAPAPAPAGKESSIQ